MRIFIAVDLSREAQREIKGLIERLKNKHWSVNWVKLGKLHLTLVFLGEIKQKKLSAVRFVCSSAASKIKPFKVSFKGLGVFPDFDWPRVIWLGLKGDLHSLSFLHKQIEKELEEKGFDFKTKPFQPHITLGRVRNARAGERRELGRQVKGMRKLDLSSEIFINRIKIFKSRLRPGGSVHKELEQIIIRG
jgi:2'-5' RNA ligase